SHQPPEELVLDAVQVARRADVQVEQARQRQVDLHDVGERDLLVEALQGDEVLLREGQRGARAQRGPFLPLEADVGGDALARAFPCDVVGVARRRRSVLVHLSVLQWRSVCQRGPPASASAASQRRQAASNDAAASNWTQWPAPRMISSEASGRSAFSRSETRAGSRAAVTSSLPHTPATGAGTRGKASASAAECELRLLKKRAAAALRRWTSRASASIDS